MDNKALLDALEQIPDLIRAAETYKATSDRIVSTLAEAVKKSPQAVVPAEEIEKIKEVIKRTPCAKPDITLISRELAGRLCDNITVAIKPAIRNAATEALKDASVTVKHSHIIERNLRNIADERMKKKVFILWLVIVVLLGVIGISATAYYISDTYWGKQFHKLSTSDYLTAEEKACLERRAGYTGILPQGYYKNPIGAQDQLKRNKAILKKREKEAKKNKGKYNTEEEIHF